MPRTSTLNWIKTLKELYDEARSRNQNKAILLYSEVVKLIDYLEGVEDAPKGFNLNAACDSLAYRLRSIN